MPYERIFPYLHSCMVCGRDYLSTRSRHKYCSPACGAAAVRVRRRRGRQRGEGHPKAKFTEQQVVEIRARYEAGRRGERYRLSMRDLAVQYGVCYDSIRKIVRRHSWAHVA